MNEEEMVLREGRKNEKKEGRSYGIKQGING